MNEIIKKGYVYLIHSEDMNHFYIGSTASVKVRFKGHSYRMRKGLHHSERLQRAVNKYGFDYFKFTVISEFDTRKESELFEQELLDKYYKDDGCLNCSSVAIMAAQCPDVIAKRNETLRSDDHRNAASLKNKEWALSNPEEAKRIYEKSAMTRNTEKSRLLRSEIRKKQCESEESKAIFKKRIADSIEKSGKQTAAKPVISIDLYGNERYFCSAAQADRETGVFFKTISRCCLGKTISAGGFTWRFA